MSALPATDTGAAGPLLTVEHLTMRFGGLVAVDDVSFAAENGAITAIIGPNGAGKTTVFNCLTGFYSPTVGRLRLQDGDREHLLERMEGYRIARTARVARTFQNIRLFPAMSVLENLLVAQHNPLMRASGMTVLGLIGIGGYRRAEREAVEHARYWLDRVGITDRADDNAGDLPYGDQRKLGLNPSESAELNRLLTFIRDEHGIGILLIEHDMSVVMGISDHIVVLDYGRKISDGAPDFVRNDPTVIRAYLGEEETDELPPEVAADLSNGQEGPRGPA
jgi:branched-chain amino acid transport system ATP-binding protein